ncbi:hypothetical protein KP509_1Z006400 [Ceratopteris richardii]|nr:hypothetical protein KP509_1Z006400 [Ceratopteris richardii]
MYTPQVGKNTLVSVDALKPGVILTGKVTKIEKFGAFVDLGAYTTGLIHISNLSKSFVNSVEDIVKFGDEVQVVVLSVDVNSRRISLRLVQQDAESNQKKPFAPQKLGHIQEKAMRLNSKHSSKVARRPQKGETFNGSIARVVPNGAFVTLNEAHEGFLPGSEVLQGGQNVKMSSFFKIGQHVHVRVLRTTKQRIILTTVKQEKAVVDCIELDPDDGRATNPFEIAFRRDKVLTKFLQEREKLHSLRKDDTKDGPDSPSTG